VPVERGAERRRDQDAARLLPDRLAGGDPSAPSRRLCRGGARGLCPVRDGRHHQYRQRLMAKGNAAPEGAVRLRHPEARSCSYGGRVYTADKSGVLTLPAAAVAELAPHGFVPVTE